MEKNKVKKGILAVYSRPEDFDPDFDPERLQIFNITMRQYKTLLNEINAELDRFREDLKRLKENPLLSEQDFLRVYDVNLFGAYRINKTFMPLLSKGGKILITTSELAPLDPLPFTGIYALSKSALDDYAYSLRMELQLLGVSVVVLRPGAVDTGMISVSTSKLDEFIAKTSMYSFGAKRFKKIVDRVEARKIPPQKIAEKTIKIISISRPKQVYKINRNPLLLILNLFPRSVQTFIIKKILKN
jgi:NAD(P)-dependent dehydrogenase (short-subunit alcohol dehydrogenase family)